MHGGYEGVIDYLFEQDESIMSEEHQGLPMDFSEKANPNQEEVDQDEGDCDEEDEEEEDEDKDENKEEEPKQPAVAELPPADNLENIEQAKSTIELFKREFERSEKTPSPCWDHFSLFQMRPNIEDSTLEDLDRTAFKCVMEAKEGCGNRCMCKTCFDTPTKAPHLCFHKGSKSGPGNLSKHLEHHPVEHAAYLQKADELGLLKKNSSRKCSPAARKRPLVASPPAAAAASKKRSNARSSPASSSAQKVSADSSLSSSTNFKPVNQVFLPHVRLGTEELLRGYHDRVHNFVTNNNVAVRACTDHSKCPEFKDLMDFAMRHGPQLRTSANLHMGTHAFTKCRMAKCNLLLGAVDMRVSESRSSHKSLLKKDTPFICFAHDGWEKDDKEALGATIHFHSPDDRRHCRCPVGLEPSSEKSADPTVIQCLDILTLCGIKMEDLCKAANDTNNTAKKVGRDLTGENGTCAMHTSQLALGHAVGMKIRTQNNEAVDNFPEAEGLRKKSLETARWLMEKKSKSRCHKCVEMMKREGREAVKLELPNSTRAAGILIHYESMIQARFNLNAHWHRTTKATKLDDDECYLISQFAAVIHPMGVLIRLVQTDKPCFISCTFIHVFRTHMICLTTESWWVAETRTEEHETETTKWTGNARFPDRDPRGKPLLSSQRGINEGAFDLIAHVKVDSHELDDLTTKLIHRLADNLLTCGAKPDKIRLLAMACNPFTATTGMLELELLAEELKELTCEDKFKEAAQDFKKLAMEELEKEIRDVCSEIIPKEGTDSESDEGGSQQLSKAQKLRMKMARGIKRSSSTNVTDPVKKQIHEFFDLDFDPVTAMATAGNLEEGMEEKLGTTPAKWITNWELIISKLDVMHWWETKGKANFPLIYPIACLVLAIPDSNGHQERTFSAATWMDGKLKKHQSDMTFQMKVLLCKNQEFLKDHQRKVEMSRRAVAEQRTKDLIAKVAAMKREEDIGEDEQALFLTCEKDAEANTSA